MGELDLDICRATFDSMRLAPRNLQKSLRATAESYDHSLKFSVLELLSFLRAEGPNHGLRVMLNAMIARWDYISDAAWVGKTRSSTPDRRNLIHEKLALTKEESALLDNLFPPYPSVAQPSFIVNPDAWQYWYTPDKRNARKFFWSAYSDYLLQNRGWNAKNVAVLDETSTRVVERLGDPTAPEPIQTKGLVIGYVQSGKTANFTGVIAKAADAGYRLIIVLAGTLNILRDQTQRRVDRELLGWELVKEDYQGDPEADTFLRHGDLPSRLGGYDWDRLTLAHEDFKRLKVGLSALEFRRVNPSKPFWDPANLYQDSARLIVIKKGDTVLKNLRDAFRRAADRGVDFANVPALVVDDESDQASVNTLKPDLQIAGAERRTKINAHIVEILKVLKRGQYVGYTATPFANVFIDPRDATDLYPSDYILSLPRPAGYMGVSDFHDDSEVVGGDFTSNQNAHVRFVQGDDSLETNLPQALDAFVLSGALKLYRESLGTRKYQHHTMLVHHSPRSLVHKDRAKLVDRLYARAGYTAMGPAWERLKRLWETDFARVCQAKAGEEAVPSSFAKLKAHIGECCRRIDEGEKRVLIVNGENNDDAPNFEKGKVWKIIVGGTKLSRGYTIEGLTVSYYRRPSGAADTLMQMGRWFGFRDGYRDLVRLYIGNHEPVGTKGKKFVNLYEAFHGICKDEEDFRAELERYSVLMGSQRITPRDIPPLVPSHILRPTSRNKMYNAVLEFKNLGETWFESTVAPDNKSDVNRNAGLMEKLFSASSIGSIPVSLAGESAGDFDAFVGTLNAPAFTAFLKGYCWLPGFESTLTRVREFLDGKGGSPEIESWLLLAPQPKASKGNAWSASGQEFAVRTRNRVGTGLRYAAYSEPLHRIAAERLAGITEGGLGRVADRKKRPHQGIMLFYPVLSNEERAQEMTPTMAFALLFPPNSIPKKLTYKVIDKKHPDAIVVSTKTR
jgi:hypothetical protein